MKKLRQIKNQMRKRSLRIFEPIANKTTERNRREAVETSQSCTDHTKTCKLITHKMGLHLETFTKQKLAKPREWHISEMPAYKMEGLSREFKDIAIMNTNKRKGFVLGLKFYRSNEDGAKCFGKGLKQLENAWR